MLVLLLTIVIFGLIAFHLYLRCGYLAKHIDKLPGPKAWPITGNLLMFLFASPEGVFKLLRKLNKQYYPLYRLWGTHYAQIDICSAEYAEIVLSSTQNIGKSLFYDLLHPWFGTGLLTSTGSKWQKRRKILTPAFHFNVLKKYVAILTENNEKLVNSLKSMKGTTVQSLLPFTTKHTLDVICGAAMGTSLDGYRSENRNFQTDYRAAIHELGKTLLYKLMRPWLRINWIYRTFSKKVADTEKKCLQILHDFSKNIIEERKQYHEKTQGQFLKQWTDNDERDEGKLSFEMRKRRLAMLDLLIAASKEGLIDDEGIQEEVDTFMFEGHDTSAMAIAFSLLLLAEHTEIQDKCREEVNKVLSESGGNMGLSEIQQFSYLERSIKEALRLYPSVPFISRNITSETKLGKYLIPAGTLCNIHIYEIHRDEKYWPDPEKFDPDRFLPERIDGRHPFCFIPFSAGARNCIGQKFAMLELKSVIAHLLHNFILEPIDLAHQVPMIPDLVLRPAKPIFIKLIPISI